MSSTFRSLYDSFGLSQSFANIISNTQSGIDSISEVYDALYELHQQSAMVLDELSVKINDLIAASFSNVTTSGTSGTSGVNGIDGTSGTSGVNGTSGTSGVNGIDGTSGYGLPSGGTIGQILVKLDSIDYNTGWATQSSGDSSNSVCFSPQPVGICDQAPTSATTQYYYQTISEVTGTISKAKIWGYSGTDTVLIGIYRSNLGSTLTLIGEGSGVCGIGPNEISLTVKSGQTLDLTTGEDLVVGYYPTGTSFRTIYDLGMNDASFGITNTANISEMPTNPTGTSTSVRFALTLYS